MGTSQIIHPRITVLTCTRNGSRTIREALDRCVREIRAWAPDRGQLIVADNGSTDATATIAGETLAESGLNTKFIRAERAGKLNAFEAGVRISDGDVVCIIDDDNFIEPGYLGYVASFFQEHPGLGIVGSANRLDESVMPPEWFEWARDCLACTTPSLEENVTVDTQGRRIGDLGYVAGAGMAFRKEPLLRALDSGYVFYSDTDRKRRITGEDIEMCFLYRSMGLRFGFDPRIQVSHAIARDRLTPEAIWHLAESVGAGVLASEPFMYTHKVAGGRLPWTWTWQWQLAAKVRRLVRFSLPGPYRGMSLAEKRFRSLRNWHECWGAIRWIMTDPSGYAAHIRKVACGPWTSLRVR